MNKKRFNCIAILIPVLMLSMLLLPACNKQKKKAIIILPGILASGLYNTETNEPLWDPFKCNIEFENYANHLGGFNIDSDSLASLIDELLPLVTDVFEQNDNSLLRILKVDEDGNPTNNIVAPVTMTYDNPTRLRYGLFNCCTEMYNELNARYGNDAEVVVFNFDWRLDNRKNADLLEDFINDNGYDEVSILAHSMGGAVTSIYLANSQENRDKVKCFTSYDTPYFGALMALEMFENMEKLINNVMNSVEEISILSSYLDGLCYSGCAPGAGAIQLREVLMQDLMPLMNIQSLFQLLPSPELIQSKHYYTNWEWENFEEQNSFIKIDDSLITTKEQLLDFYKSRDWAKKEDGTLKEGIAELEDYWDSFYVDVDGKQVYATTLVNTHYFVGINYSTSSVVNYSATEYDQNMPIFDSAINNLESDKSLLGDGTVLAYSSTANHSLTAENVHIVENADHFDTAIPFKSTVADETYKFLDKIIFG